MISLSSWSSIVFVCFSIAFPCGEQVNLDCCIIGFELEDYISSPVKYSCLSNLPDDRADAFAASLLI